MANTTISGLNPTLQAIKSMKVAVDRYDDQGLPVETNNLTLEQILELFEVIGNTPPTGTPLICVSDTIPSGYLELNGDPFDMALYPQLALVFPSGILPDWRGRTPKHTPDGAVTGTTEEDENKSHSHAIQVNNKDLGTKTTNTTGNHAHTYSRSNASGGGNGVNRYAINGNASTSTTGNHAHTLALGEHNHEASCSESGAQENTVKGVFVRYMTRAR